MHDRREAVGDDKHRRPDEALADRGRDLCVHPLQR